MDTYTIHSKAGVDMGKYTGERMSDALLLLHREAGYGERDVWQDDDGDLVFRDDETRRLLGDVSDWIIIRD